VKGFRVQGEERVKGFRVQGEERVKGFRVQGEERVKGFRVQGEERVKGFRVHDECTRGASARARRAQRLTRRFLSAALCLAMDSSVDLSTSMFCTS
jgi:hypothetical protein